MIADKKFTQPVSYQKLLDYGRSELQKAGIEEAQIDGWYLFEFVTGMGYSQFFVRSQEFASKEEVQKYIEVLQKRSLHIPLQHITGEQEFMGLSFKVNEHVLVPRQDTESLVELAMDYVEDKMVLDMCTGSGCIAISLMHYGKPKEVHAADISAKALEVAKENSFRNHVDIVWHESNLFEQISNRFDVIVSNPPYIPPKVIEKLMPEVKEHEPRMALDGGEDGLDFYRQITAEAVDYLNDGGYLFYEIGHNQAEAVIQIMQDIGFTDVICKKDYAGNDRVVFGKYLK